MPVLVECQVCHRKLRVPEELVGKQVKCPCGAVFLAAAAAGAPPPAPSPAPPPQAAPRPAPPRQEASAGQEGRPGDFTPHRGVLIMVLGIISVVCLVVGGVTGMFLYGIPTLVFSLIGIGIGIPPWIMGQKDLAKMKDGEMDPTGKGMTMAGWICGIVGTALNGLALVCCGAILLLCGASFLAIMSSIPTTTSKQGFAPTIPVRRLTTDGPSHLTDYLPER